MNPHAPRLARDTFLQAIEAGPSREPAVLSAVLDKLADWADDWSFDIAELEKGLDAEFPWLNQFVFQSRRPQPEETEAWVHAVRWLMQSLLAPHISTRCDARRVHVLLTALGVLDVGFEGLNAVSDQLAGTHVPTSIVSMLQMIAVLPEDMDARSKEWLRELQSDVEAGKFKSLQRAQGRLQPRFQSNIWTMVFLLWKLEPTELASLIQSRESILLNVVICTVLDANAPMFALQVESVTFKFISLAWLERKERVCPDNDAARALEQLLLQAAMTPHWKAWLEATYEHPVPESGRSRALAEALTQLSAPQWEGFVLALAPSKSPSSAAGVADILMHVARKLGFAELQPLWLMAFERWDAWDYGRGDRHFYLSSPQACAFDFPVAMYYALMPMAERNALERELQGAILFIEQRWFSNASELLTERNRLASRLRLVRHGSAVADGGRDPLPPPVQPDSEYAEVRYRYHDVNQAHARTVRR